MGIEPTLEAWEAAVLPLNYTRELDRNNHYTRSDNAHSVGLKQDRPEPLQYRLWKSY